MASLRVDREACKGCGICCKACPQDALRLRDSKVKVDTVRCVLCSACVSACPFGALRVEKETAFGQDDAQSSRDVWVFAESVGGAIAPVAFELLGKGRQLAEARGCRLVVLLFGHGVAAEANALIAAGADTVLLCDDAAMDSLLDEPYADLTASLAKERKPEILLFGATAFGRSLAPRVAARLGTGLTADCTGLEIDLQTGLMRQTRPAFGGNLMATIITEHARPQMATVRPGVMPALPPDATREGTVERVPPPGGAPKVQLLEESPQPKASSIADARIIVSAGQGIGSQKNMSLVEKLAQHLGAAVGATRPLVDMGWTGYHHQIGQTGITVAPDLLICCGISGAIQHLAGIGGAKTIVAINSDSDAPIFSLAHYKLVADCTEVLPELLAQLNAE